MGVDCYRIPDASITYLQDSTVYTFWPDELYAPTIQIAWQRTDIARWNAPATPTPTSSTSELSSTPTTSSSPSGLSTGAKAGIGVGAAAAGLFVIAIVFCVFWRRRGKQRGVHHNETPEIKQAERSGEGKRHSELAGLQETRDPTKGDRYEYRTEAPEPAEMESGWLGIEAPTTDTQRSRSRHIGTNSRDEIEAQGATDLQGLPAVLPIR